MHQWQSLILASWTLFVSYRSASVKKYYCTRVTLRLFRIYMESVTMCSQEPPKKKSKNQITDYFVCTVNAHARMSSIILCQYAPARTIWKNTTLIRALNHK